jgi:hypothetical protein
MTYILVKENGLIYGYHTKKLPGSVETNVDPNWLEQNTGTLYFLDTKFYKKEIVDNKEIQAQIIQLHQNLSETDWKVVVNQELKALGQPAKYDEQELHTTRQGWRDEINILENQIMADSEMKVIKPVLVKPQGTNS